MPQSLISFLLVAVMSLSSCAKPKVAVKVVEPVSEIPAHAFQPSDPNLETIAVVAMNDFHGSLLAKERKLPDGRTVKSGGAEALSGMIKILRSEMPGRVLIVDAGDDWQGTLESNLSKGETVVEFYNRLGVNVAAIGNHEFDFGLINMKNQMSHAQYGYVAANITEKKTHEPPTWPNVSPSKMIKVGRYKIGVVGFSTLQTPSTTRFVNVADLDFNEPAKPISKAAKKLRKKGANLVLVTAHAGTVCEDKLGLHDWKIWTEKTPASSCDDEQEIYKLAQDLKSGLVDGMISGHTHHIIHHFLNHIPVVQDEAYNQFFNIIYYTFDKATKQVIPALTRIEGLIPICFETFAGTSDCDIRHLAKNESPQLVQAYFHGKPVEHDEAIQAWLKPIEAGTDQFRKQVIAKTELPLTHNRDQESPFGNLMADILREKAHADFSLVNSGGIRASLDAGDITYDGLYRALPFDNALNVVTMTGAQVKIMYRLATSGTHGYPGIAGARLTLIPLNEKAPKTDLNGDGKLERWETNHLLKVERDDGSAIDDQKLYTVATYDFLVTGGDDMRFVMNQIDPSRIYAAHTPNCRDMVSDYLREHPVINTALHPLVDPKRPRFILVPNSGL